MNISKRTRDDQCILKVPYVSAVIQGESIFFLRYNKCCGILIQKDCLIADNYLFKMLYNKTHILICNSRPRRFGKSVTADMLTAYYSKGCNSERMFSDLAISRNSGFKEHLNKYDLIHLDVQWCIDPAAGIKFIVIIDEWDVLIRDAAANQAVSHVFWLTPRKGA